MNAKESSLAPNSPRPLTFAEKLKQKQVGTGQRIITHPIEMIKQDDPSQNKGKFKILEIIIESSSSKKWVMHLAK